MKKVLAIDYGKKRIGLSISDIFRSIALSLKTIEAGGTLEKSADNIVNVINQRDDVDTIVLGLPLLMNNQESPMSLEVRKLAKILIIKLPNYKITFFDERLTSSYADRILRESGIKRKKRNKITDPIAATIFLQNYLDSIHNLTT